MQTFLKFLCLLLSAILLASCTVNNYYYAKPRSVMPLAPLRAMDYQPEEQCQIACFSYDNAQALYPLSQPGKTIYVKGFMSVSGKRDAQNICRPRGYGYVDISVLPEFKSACKIFVKSCGDHCWAGGNS